MRVHGETRCQPILLTTCKRSSKTYESSNRQKNASLERLHVVKRIGWHSFRHGLATLLRQNGVDVKTAQELLRHANSRITLDIYQQTVPEERRAAQALAFRNLVGGLENRTIKHHDLAEKEEVILGTA